MTTTTSWREESVEVGGSKVQVFKGGSGPPLFALHGAGGNRGWMPYHQALSESYTVYVPSHPGYDQSEQPPWLTTMNDMAHFYLGVFPERWVTNRYGSWVSPWEGGSPPRSPQCARRQCKGRSWWMQSVSGPNRERLRKYF